MVKQQKDHPQKPKEATEPGLENMKIINAKKQILM